MIPFLKQVANHYFDCGNISDKCFIFPNRRSLLFFRKYLSEAVKDTAKPILEPQMFTMNDFFFRVSSVSITDRVSLLLCLYDCYKALYPKAESLDEFIFWGDVILADFDDVDKYKANPKGIFTNIADLKAIQDNFSYLSDVQRRALEEFLGHFRIAETLKVDLESSNPNVKEKFIQIWDLLYPLYVSFNKSLAEQGQAYEGMAYRHLAEKMEKEPAPDVLKRGFSNVKGFVFVGLNALNECEKLVMGKMRDAGMAEFCWDYSTNMIKNPQNKSSFFMQQNVTSFPQAFKLSDDEQNIPNINVISVPSSIGQVKQVPNILKEHSKDCAIVLPDENLLIPLLNTIPEDIEAVKITMGYPMSGSSFYALMTEISAMQLHLRHREDGWYYYYKQVWSIFSNGIFVKVCGVDELEAVSQIKQSAKLYVPQSDLSGNWLFDLVFRPIVTDPKASTADSISSLEDYQLSVLEGIAPKLKEDSDMSLELNFAKEYFSAVNRLKSVQLHDIVPATYFRFLQQLLGGMSVPFRGEPLKGLQIMGPLETRALDFKNLIILSCNEGMFPRRSVISSFIPAELRTGFNLPTYENQDKVWAYYFYRMIQRAENVWLIYDSRTEGLQTGEESRYIKQLEYHFRVKLNRFVAKPAVPDTPKEIEISKSEDDVKAIRNMTFSASSLQKYLSCPAQFYYHYIKKYEPESEVSESMDGGMIGSVYHDTMFSIYVGGDALKPDFDMDRENMNEYLSTHPLKDVTKEYVDSILKAPQVIKDKIRALVKKNLNSVEVSGRNLVLEAVILIYVQQTLRKDRQLMEEEKVDRIRIYGLEKKVLWSFNGFNFVGYLDRLDGFHDDELRIVDYKTGKVQDNEENINSENAADVVDKLFMVDSPSRPKIALQLFLYDKFLESNEEYRGKTFYKCIYKVPTLFTSEINKIEKCEEFDHMVEDRLKTLFDDMTNLSIPFRRTEDTKLCGYCDFKNICGR